MLRLAVLILAVLAPGAAALSVGLDGPAGTQVDVDGTKAVVDASALGHDVVVAADGTSLAVSAPALPSLDLDAPPLDLALASRAAHEDAAPASDEATIAGVPTELAAPAAAAGASAIGLAILWRLLGFSVPFAGRLFSRIEAPRVLDNPVRARLHDLVAARPGATLEELRATAGIAWGTAVHHLRRLEAHGLVVSTVGARHRFFPANTAASKHRASLALLAQPTAQRIARAVQATPGIGQEQLCLHLGLNAPAASKHLGRLATQGLVTVRVDGRRRHYEATDALRAALAIGAEPIVEAPATMVQLVSQPVAVAA